MYYVYILKSIQYKKTYTGITNDLLRRIKEHNAGHHVYTKRYKPWTIIYSEKFKNRIEAHKKEKYLKSASGRRWLKKNIFVADVAELVYAQS
jgi:putative endonuclease